MDRLRKAGTMRAYLRNRFGFSNLKG